VTKSCEPSHQHEREAVTNIIVAVARKWFGEGNPHRLRAIEEELYAAVRALDALDREAWRQEAAAGYAPLDLSVATEGKLPELARQSYEGLPRALFGQGGLTGMEIVRNLIRRDFRDWLTDKVTLSIREQRRIARALDAWNLATWGRVDVNNLHASKWVAERAAARARAPRPRKRVQKGKTK
jgi:hypothetical protein